MAFQAERAESPWVSRLGSPGPWGFHLDVRSLPRLRMEGRRHCSQVSSPQPHTRDSSLRGLAPVAPSPARFIPKGFQPIAGGERSVTTGSPRPSQPIPKGLQPCVSLTPSRRLESLRDTGAWWNMNRWCSLRSTTGYGLRPLRGGRVARIPRIRRRMATTLLRKFGRSESTGCSPKQIVRQHVCMCSSTTTSGVVNPNLSRFIH